jgi:hypothetical protein
VPGVRRVEPVVVVIKWISVIGGEVPPVSARRVVVILIVVVIVVVVLLFDDVALLVLDNDYAIGFTVFVPVGRGELRVAPGREDDQQCGRENAQPRFEYLRSVFHGTWRLSQGSWKFFFLTSPTNVGASCFVPGGVARSHGHAADRRYIRSRSN